MSPRRRALLTMLKLCDLAVVTASLVLSVAISTVKPGTDWLSILQVRLSLGNFLFAGAYLVAWHFVLRARGLYGSYRLSVASRELRDLGMAVTIATVPLLPLSIAFDFAYVTPIFLLIFPLLTFASLSIERRLLRTVARWGRTHGRNLREVVIVGDGGAALEGAARLAQRDDLGYRVVEVISSAPSGHENGKGKSPSEILERVQALVERRTIDEVFLALPLDGSQPLLASVIALCEEQGITLRVVANLAVLDWGRASIDTLGGQPVLTISSGPPDTLGLLAKRALDLVGTAVGLVVLAPLFALIAIAIRFDSKGPVVFSQERVGYNRRRFKAYKFRTMVVGAEGMQASLEHMNEAVGPVFKIKNDPRVTRVGKWLRRLSLDELPQLFNVILGDMSLVGPRPLPVRDVSRMDVRWHRRRFSVKPGITCLWQVNSRTPNFDEWIRSDMEYIDNWSLSLDFKILAKTLPAVWSGQGAH